MNDIVNICTYHPVLFCIRYNYFCQRIKCKSPFPLIIYREILRLQLLNCLSWMTQIRILSTLSVVEMKHNQGKIIQIFFSWLNILNYWEIVVNKMKSNATFRVFLYKISRSISETCKQKQILDDVKNGNNDDENANYTITSISDYANFSSGFVFLTMDNR